MAKMKNPVSRLIESFAGRMIEEKVSVKVKEQVNAKLKEFKVNPTATNRQDLGWRPLSTRETKDINPLTQTKMQAICYHLYDQNPMGHRLVERYKDFVIGDGMKFDCDDKQVLNDVLIPHWEDSDNLWEQKQYQKVKELSIYGEQFYPAFVNKNSGKVKLGYTDPEQVETVLTDPKNAEKKIKYLWRSRKTAQLRPKTIINMDNNPQSDTYELLIGEAFTFSINRVSNATRGRSDLFPVADGIDAYENFLFNRAERADLMNRVILEIELQGMTQDQCDQFMRDHPNFLSNTWIARNEKTKLNWSTPDLGSQDASEEARMLFNHWIGGAGMPPTWFGMGEGLTKGTAMMMDLPTKKQLRGRQRFFRWMVSFIFRYCIHQAIIADKIPRDKKDVKIKIDLPKIEEKEITAIATALVGVTQSLSMAVEEDWVSKSTAQKVYAYMLSLIGQEIEPENKEFAKESDKKTKELYEKDRARRKKEGMKKDKIEIPEEEKEEEEEENI